MIVHLLQTFSNAIFRATVDKISSDSASRGPAVTAQLLENCQPARLYPPSPVI